MFSVREKQEIAEKIQVLLKQTNHPELPKGEISFNIHIYGDRPWSWADIRNNGYYNNERTPSINPWNEQQDKRK